MADTGATEAPALPGDGLRESIVDDLRRHIGEGLLEFVLKPQDDLWIRVSAATWAATGRALRATGFEYFCFLSAIDWKPSPFGRGEDDPTQPPPERLTAVKQGYAGGTTRFQVFARVTDIKRHVGVTLKVDVDDEGGDLAIDSWHAVYAGANWHERETHEMYGISFTGHPDLRNMYLPTDFEGYPLRKDFPLLARMVKPWPGIVDVEPMPVEETAAEDAGDAIAPPVADRAVEAGAVDDGAVEAGAVEDADTAGDAGGAVGEEAPEVDRTGGADESGDSVSANLTGAGASADAEPGPASVSGDVTDSGASADTESESVAPPTAEEVEAAAHDVADEDRVADEAAADDAAAVESAEVEAVTIEPGATDSGAPIDPASTEDAGPESEAAEHPESAADPAAATEETVGDAPDHSAASDDASDAVVTASAPDPSADDPETGDGGAGAHPGAEPDVAP